MSQDLPQREHPSTYFVQDRSNLDEMTRLKIQDQLLTTGMGGVLSEQSNPSTFGRILDVGCGTGGWLIEIAKRYPTSQLLVGVDISKKLLHFARSEAVTQGVGDRVSFHVMDALRMLEFPGGFFDLVNHRLAVSYLRTWDWLSRANGAACLLILFPSEIVLNREDDENKENKMYPRSSVAAVIIRDECLLVVKKRDEKGIVYSFPTGGQEAGETLVQAVQREVLEEVGCEIMVGPLLWVREYIGKHHENADLEGDVHVVCHLFHCTISQFSHPFQGKAPDPTQEDIEWLPLQQLTTYRFYPQALIPSLLELEQGNPFSVPIYVGDVN